MSAQGRASRPDGPIEIAERIYWLGRLGDVDPYPSHVYLIENGDQSVLIDPGSRPGFTRMRAKLESVIALDQVRYFVCHHQDPDITACLPLLDELVRREDALVVSHWRAETLIKHFGLRRLSFWLVEEHGWRLDLGGRLLRFIFTPYLHFPGAFCSFDTRTGVLFSSDLFSAMGPNEELVARDVAHFDNVVAFHRHYMPSQEILNAGLDRLVDHPIQLIAPQHGALIPRELIGSCIQRLRALECGLTALQDGTNEEARQLVAANRLQRQLLGTMGRHRTLKDVAPALLEVIRGVIPEASFLEFFAAGEPDKDTILQFDPGTRFRGVEIEMPAFVRAWLGTDATGIVDQGLLKRSESGNFRVVQANRAAANGGGAEPALAIALAGPSGARVSAMALIHLERDVEVSPALERVLKEIRGPLAVAIERERIYRQLEEERLRIYERSIRDPLTGLHTRAYMHEVVQRLMELHDRDESAAVALALFDVDHFKAVNDLYGHPTGDLVLKLVGEVLRQQIRRGDLPVRLGGEEFAIFFAGRSARHVKVVAERVRSSVELCRLARPLHGLRITVSAGVAVRARGEALEALLARADKALYRAKRDGRNRVHAEEP